MKIIENITLYKCEFCGKKLFIKQAMQRHEVKCNKNPENIPACFGCKFLEQTTNESRENHSEYGEVTQGWKAFRCTKLDKMLYPAKVVHKGILERYPESFEGQEQMPKECEYYSFDPGF